MASKGNLKERTARGLFWGVMNSGVTQVLNVVIGILLGRMIAPAEWAPIGMIAIFSAIAGNLQSSGFSTAIVNMKQPTDNDYNAVFWFNILMSACIYLLLFMAAPWIALFFEQGSPMDCPVLRTTLPDRPVAFHLPCLLHLVIRYFHQRLHDKEHDEP